MDKYYPARGINIPCLNTSRVLGPQSSVPCKLRGFIRFSKCFLNTFRCRLFALLRVIRRIQRAAFLLPQPIVAIAEQHRTLVDYLGFA